MALVERDIALHLALQAEEIGVGGAGAAVVEGLADEPHPSGLQDVDVREVDGRLGSRDDVVDDVERTVQGVGIEGLAYVGQVVVVPQASPVRLPSGGTVEGQVIGDLGLPYPP